MMSAERIFERFSAGLIGGWAIFALSVTGATVVSTRDYQGPNWGDFSKRNGTDIWQLTPTAFAVKVRSEVFGSEGVSSDEAFNRALDLLRSTTGCRVEAYEPRSEDEEYHLDRNYIVIANCN